jgi:hypothetical protein
MLNCSAVDLLSRGKVELGCAASDCAAERDVEWETTEDGTPLPRIGCIMNADAIPTNIHDNVDTRA